MQRVHTALQLLQDDGLLDSHRHRFSESPPPYESPPTTEPPSPLTLHAQRSAYDQDELFHGPLSNHELYLLRVLFRGYHAGDRYSRETGEERERVREVYYARDKENNRLYNGIDLEGRAGGQRCLIMIRSCIRKRWQRLGVWNPAWGIPGRLNSHVNDDSGKWRWEWAEPDLYTRELESLTEQENAEWPSGDQETASERAIRRFVQQKKRWSENVKISNGGSQVHGQVDIDPREQFIIDRPWFQFELEVAEEARRLERVQRSEVFETASINTRTRWQHDERWKDTWYHAPGWKWRHESPSPEPEDPNNIDFSPSEIDALEAIPPPTPPKPRHVMPAAPLSLFGSTPRQSEHIDANRDISESRSNPEEHTSKPKTVQGRKGSAKSSTKRKRKEEESRPEDGALPVKRKRVNFKRQGNAPVMINDLPTQDHLSGPSISESNNRMEADAGSLWLDIPPPAPVRVTSTSKVGARCDDKLVKVRRSARLAGRCIPITNKNS